MFCLYFGLGIVACFIVYSSFLIFLKKNTIRKIKDFSVSIHNWIKEQFHTLVNKFYDLVEVHPILAKPWLWLLIGLLLGFTLVYIVTFIKNQEIVISFLSAFGTIAAVWASILFYIHDNQKNLVVEIKVNYTGGTAGELDEISVETYAINASKFDFLVNFIGLTVFNKECGPVDIRVVNDWNSTIIRHGQASEKLMARKEDIVVALKRIQYIKENYGYGKKPIQDPDVFIFQAMFDVDGEQYVRSAEVDLSDAIFWKKIKGTK